MSYTVDNVVRDLKELREDYAQGDARTTALIAIDKAIAMLSSPDMILIEWVTDDVHAQAKEKGLRISNEDARNLLADMERKHDASIGINWDVIDCYLDNPMYNATPIEYIEEE